MSLNKSVLRGKHTEHYALRYLLDQGLQLIEHNWHSRYGEIDIIMLDSETLVFIEVRYRKNATFGSAFETVNASKQQKIARTAQAYLLQHPHWQEHACRFDVVAVHSIANNRFGFNWLQHAFEFEPESTY